MIVILIEHDTITLVSIVMAHRAIPMITFHGVESIYIYIYFFFLVSTCVSMRCIRS